MLNITNYKLNKEVSLAGYRSMQKVARRGHYKKLNRFLWVFFFIGILTLFLPWTQTISGRGFLTTLKPDQRPQTIQSAIAGRIERWYVREGDFVKKGDTILHISEIKAEYLDPDLLGRTQQQVKAKELTVTAYSEKVKALENQIAALQSEQRLKLQQARNKLIQAKLKAQSDSIDFEAAKTNLSIAERQYARTQQLQAEGLKAVTDVEEKRLKLQETQASIIARENTLLASKNEILNARVEITRTQAEYADKIAKAQSDRYTALSDQYNSDAALTKLQNEFTNYEIRNQLYYVTAPQDGYINKALQSGIGETFKEGIPLVGIMPANYEPAVETFVAPIDLPLIHVGERVRVQFDGWPAIVFSGWPNVSYGTYGGIVVAVETFISDNGKFRVLIAPDPNDHPWPKAIRVGSGAYTMALLDNVPIWFELWRRLNGFPPNYYQSAQAATNHSATK